MILDEVCELIIDTEHKTAPNVDVGIPSIRTPNVGKGRLILDKDIKFVDEPTFVEWTKRAIPKKDDLIIAREAPVGNVAIVPDIQLCLGQRTVLARPDIQKVIPEYLCYYLLSPKMQYKMLAGSGGSTVAHLNMKDIRNLELEVLPPLTAQRKIASILSAYDDLIENNLKRIKLMEEKAKCEYNIFMASSDLEKLPLGQIAIIDWGDTSITKSSYVKNGYKAFSASGADGFLEYFDFNEPGIVVSAIGAYCGKIWFTLGKWSAIKNTMTILPKSNIPIEFIFQSLNNPELWPRRGAAQPFLSKTDASQIIINVPKNADFNTYSMVSRKNYELIEVLENQNAKLREARDILLPKLMNGQIEV